MKLKTSEKMSDKNIDFWKRLNINLIKTDRIEKSLSYSDSQEEIVKFFKTNNNIYLDLLESIGNSEKNKNGV